MITLSRIVIIIEQIRHLYINYVHLEIVCCNAIKSYDWSHNEFWMEYVQSGDDHEEASYIGYIYY